MRLPSQSAGVNRNALDCMGDKGQAVRYSHSVVPQLYDYYKITGLLNLRLLVKPSPPSCDLSCGEKRADCYRMGGSRTQCDQKGRQCLWDCTFFNRVGSLPWPGMLFHSLCEGLLCFQIRGQGSRHEFEKGPNVEDVVKQPVRQLLNPHSYTCKDGKANSSRSAWKEKEIACELWTR